MIYIDSKSEQIFIYRDRLEEIFEFGEKNILDNIYLGRVVEYNSSLEAYFVDIGRTKVYLKKSDSGPLNIGEKTLLQITKMTEDKFPKAVVDFTIPGRYMVKIGGENKFSKKLSKEEVEDLKKYSFEGVLFRTESKSATEEELLNEYEKLNSIYNMINYEKDFEPAPRLLYRRDVVEEVVGRYDEDIITNDREIYKKYKNNYKIEYDKNFEIRYSKIYLDYLKLFEEKVELKSGGNIVIEDTTALTVIDVNSDKNWDTSMKNLALSTNREAIEEIMWQVKLRNISGIIIVDFINMKDQKDREKILNFAKKLNSTMNLKLSIHGFTKLGLLEISRQNMGERRKFNEV